MTRTTTRRRGAALENAILDAAWAELEAGGWAGFTMQSVSARAGTAKAVIYRRWRNRMELAADLLERETASRQWSRTRSIDLVTDLRSFLHEMAGFLASPYGDAVRGVMTQGDSARRASLLAGPVIIGRVRTIAEAAQERGELVVEPPGSVLNLGHAVMMSEFLHTGRPADEAGVESVLNDLWLPAIRASQSRSGADGARPVDPRASADADPRGAITAP